MWIRSWFALAYFPIKQIHYAVSVLRYMPMCKDTENWTAYVIRNYLDGSPPNPDMVLSCGVD